MAILDNIRNSTPYRVYVKGSPESPLSSRGSVLAGIILRVMMLNFEKIYFWPKIYGNLLDDQWPFWII